MWPRVRWDNRDKIVYIGRTAQSPKATRYFLWLLPNIEGGGKKRATKMKRSRPAPLCVWGCSLIPSLLNNISSIIKKKKKTNKKRGRQATVNSSSSSSFGVWNWIVWWCFWIGWKCGWVYEFWPFLGNWVVSKGA